MKKAVLRIFKKTSWITAALVLLVTLVTLSVAFAEGPAATGVSLDKIKLDLVSGKTATLTATVEPAGATFSTKTWSSSDETIASVNEGEVTANAEGTVDITVTVTTESEIFTATCKVNVTPPPTITLDKHSVEVYTCETAPLVATVLPADAATVVWSSGDDKIATVNNGIITAVSPGVVTITAASADDSTIKDECTVTVLQSVMGIGLDITSLEMCEGDTVTLNAAVSPAEAADKTVIWSSDNENIATVTNGGVVSILSVGTVNIKAKTQNRGLEAVCAITVKADKISSVTYTAQDGYLSGVSKYTILPLFIANLNNDSNSVRVFKTDGSELASGIIGTGMTVKLYVGGVERNSLTIIVNGDANGDGGVSISDYTMARLDILGLKPLTDFYRIGADVNGDGNISISDYTLMRLDILGLKPISSVPLDLPAVTDPNIRRFLDIALAQQGKPYIWGSEGPDSYDCSGFIYYCLKNAGYTGTLWRATADTYSRWANWTYINRNELQPGDLMFYFSDTPDDGDHIGHIGIYLGNGYHIHASSDYGYVVICRVEGWYDTMLSHGRRVIF